MDAWGSHIYILTGLIDALKPKKVLETGMGFNSTKLFMNLGIETISIEMQDSEWYQKVFEKYQDESIFKPHLLLGTEGAINLIDSLGRFDFIFIDGHGDNRWEQINVSFDHTDIIIAHDTEAKVYEWWRTDMPEGWTWVDFTEGTTWTSVLTKDVEKIKNLFSYKHCKYTDITNKQYLKHFVIKK